MLETVNGIVLLPVFYMIYYLVKWEWMRWVDLKARIIYGTLIYLQGGHLKNL